MKIEFPPGDYPRLGLKIVLGRQPGQALEDVIYQVVHLCCGTSGTLRHLTLLDRRKAWIKGRVTGQCSECAHLHGNHAPRARPTHPHEDYGFIVPPWPVPTPSAIDYQPR